VTTVVGARRSFATLLTVVALAGCERDRAAPLPLAGPGPVLRENAVVRGTIETTTEIVVNGRTATRAEPARPAVARVRGGVAATEDGIVVATSSGPSQAQRRHSSTDSTGRRHDIALSSPAAGAPPSRLRHFVDGQLTVEVEDDWQGESGNWTLAKRTILVYRNGQVVFRHERRARPVEISLVPTAWGNSLAQLGAAALAAALPRPLYADEGICDREFIRVGLAASALVATLAAALEDPADPLNWTAVAAAVYRLEEAYYQLLRCLVSGGTSAGDY
jgi:hypothetical protein